MNDSGDPSTRLTGHVRCFWTLALGIGLACMAPGQADAQTLNGLRPLAIPEGLALNCKIPEKKPLPPGVTSVVERQFDIGGILEYGADRLVRLNYDSTGSPVLFFEVASRFVGGDSVETYSIAALLHNDSFVGGMYHLVARKLAGGPESLASPDDHMTATYRALTNEEGADARRLALWLWSRRCQQI